MKQLPASTLPTLLQELFQLAQTEGMHLTLTHYQALLLAVELGYGLGGWSDLHRVCHRLWVNPHPHYSSAALDRALIQFRQRHPQVIVERPHAKSHVRDSSPEPPPLHRWPQLPPGKVPDPVDPRTDGKGLAGVQTTEAWPTSPRGASGFQITPSQFPMTAPELQDGWRRIKHHQRVQSTELELDIEASLNAIMTQGLGAALVFRQVFQRGLELVLLLDDSVVMHPYHVALDPLFEMIVQKRIDPVQKYRFAHYPGRSFAPWDAPTQLQPLDTLLVRWTPRKTIVLIWSDAGAAPGSGDRHRLPKTLQFLQRVLPSIRQLIWLNPLPESRWQGTPAQAIAQLLNGRMVGLSPQSWTQMAHGADLPLRLMRGGGA